MTPEQVAIWAVDDETDEPVRLDSYTNWVDDDGG